MVRKRHVFLACICLLHVAFGAQPPAARVDPAECRSLMDLYFVIDGSDSIDAGSFKHLKEAIASIVPEIDLGPNKARIGMLVYSSNVPQRSEHNFSYDPGYLLNAAYTLQHPRDGTDTRLGIKHMRKIFRKEGRPDVPWVCVVITDGISKNPPATIKEAKEAAKMGISMFAVGVGMKIAIQELEDIASTQNQVMAIRDFSELRDMLSTMMFQICPCPVPPTLPRAKCNDGPRAIGSVRTYECMDGYLQRGNPNIRCQGDFTWTSLATDFNCVPCSDTTPLVENGKCSAGKVTIGAKRTYTCDIGYRGVGTPITECLQDATWSIPSFECASCGKTPDITHGICGVGDFTIGAKRKFTCKPGYRLIGKETIECLDNTKWAHPRWSTPDVKCVPCGDTPAIPHGICGVGDFTIGAKRTFTCKPGYRLIGKDTIECIDNTKWAHPRWSTPDVKCVPCGDTPTISHGICGVGDFTIGAKRKFTCKPGYRLIGKETIECLDNHKWAQPRWSTPDVKCVPCGDTPTISHGICGVGDFTIGAKRKFTCKPGYRLIGKETIECLDNHKWAQPRWSTPDVKCVPCGDTPAILHGICGVGDFTIGAMRTFTCKPGYRLIGKETIECLDNTKWAHPRWSTPDVKCVPCGDTPVIPHGICGVGDFTIGAMRTFTCKPGYRLIGKETIECLDNTKWAQPRWSTPDVKCVPCGDTPTISHGICGVGDFTIGAKRTFTCKPGYRLIGKETIECLDNTKWAQPRWSTPDVKCVPCGDTPTISHGICGVGDFTIGAKRKFTCKPGYRLIGKETIECLDNHKWAQPRWSTPDVKCVPCGDTPAILHGICGVGDFTIGAMRTFTCKPGYRLIGKETIECLDNTKWAHPRWSTPDVKCVPCGDTPVIPHGICGVGDFTIGAMRTFTCKPGYRLIGKETIECLDNTKWAQPRWSTPDVKCVPCGDTPTISHGICGVGDFTIGAKRTFTCKPGYRLIGKETIECLDNTKWAQPRWSTPDVKCVPCGDTPTISHGICGVGDFTIGAKRKFTCKPGYRLIGKETIECLDNHKWAQPRWSTPDLKCVPCGDTPAILHGICGVGDFTIGAMRTFTCKPGYRLIGKETIECLDNTKWAHPRWSTPDVKCVPCGDTPTISHGICGVGDFTIGAKRTFTCKPGYRLIGKETIECLDNTKWAQPRWSTPDVKCVPCGDTPTISHGICGVGDFTIGAKRTFTCKPGYRLIGKETIECLDNHKWTQPRWSTPDVKCVPCGDTPVIPHGICGIGDFTIGAKRIFTCKPGYRLIGKETIECLDNTKWAQPRWSTPDVKCVPCGDTPVIPHGICGIGDFTIGAKRTFTCKPGYRLIGKETIECLDNTKWAQPRWSTPDVKCVPCGDTPAIPHGICGIGDFTIGAKRIFTCKPGYRLIGKETIECLDNTKWAQPRWSTPDVKCVPCGDTPAIPHGICGIGDFTIGAKRIFTCKPGYRLIGKETIECLDNTKWAQPQWSTPDVKCVPCGDTPAIPHGICGIGDFTIGAKRIFTCKPGYRLIGKETIECLDNTKWAQPRWSTPDVKCVPCGDTPAIPHGICGIGDFTIGAKRIFTCKPGYRLIGKETIECLDNTKWAQPRWSTPDVKCVPCGDTPAIPHGICGIGDFTIGAKRIFTCKPGYRLIGKETIECLDNTKWAQPQWSTPDVKCVPCGDTPAIPHGICGIGDFTIGAKRTFTCKPGYRLIGKETIECLDNTKWAQPRWSTPDVKCVPCGDTPTISHGICGVGDFTIGAKRTFTCKPGYRLIGKETIECLDNTKWAQPRWSKPDVKCVPCGDTPAIPHGICGIGDFTIGAKRIFTCKPGYRLIGKETIECLDNTKWAQPRWSTPDVKCVPCGDTPAIHHGICGIGDFTIGAKRIFTCKPGYRLIGKETIECLDNTKWAQPRWSTPDVKCVPCGDTPAIPHGICGIGDFTIGAKRTFTCKPGYRLIGKETIECLDNTKWSQPRWSTPDVKCVPCGDTPTISHGICGVGDFTIGAKRTFTCKPGYRLIGKETIECLDNHKWTQPRWSTPDVKCVPCGDTPAIPHGICGIGDFTIGAKRIFTCKPGYRLIGKETIECLDNTKWAQPRWSTPDVKCVPCGDTPTISHGICGVGDFTIGAKRTFTCKPGYRLIGKETIECLDNTKWAQPRWSTPDVECVPCGDTPAIPHGICGIGDFTIGAKRKFTCKPGYRLIGKETIECLDNIKWGHPRWSKPDVKCVPCGDTPTISHGICGVGDFTIGAKRTFTCKPGYRLIGKETIECLDNAKWAHPRWSKPDVKCVSCGDTPTISHGICGLGDFTIGAKRKFTCKPGYRLIGKETIKCIDNKKWAHPRWSKPDLKCVPCGDTPAIAHGICGIGDFTIGAKRTFTCKSGYRLIGKETIECLDNTKWGRPRWSTPDVKCVPCGDTPTISHGICGVGDFTIGAKRTFTCKPGYRLIGKETIECLDNTKWTQPQWSTPDVKCVPCGDTPTISHGICGVGDFTIGAKRTFTCKPGYRLIGKETIECLDNTKWAQPRWSKPDVKCVPCGDTPAIPHGICGIGDFTIGSKRIFTCKPGYRLIGKETIECIDNTKWAQPRWSKPDVKCVPCGDTPTISHGICGVGDFTIGAKRKITCKPGYRLIGKETIECLDNISWKQPQWSTADVKCVPCGDTPDVEHATCDVGDYLIGSVRTYSCASGYFLNGKPEINCLDDATWSEPKFTCRGCGDPPIVTHAYTGTGPDLIGSKRVYSCEEGFDMIGRGEITCNRFGQWGKPRFSCKGIPPKPPVSNDPSVCDGCRYMNGVGYNYHPFDCNQYVQCFIGKRGLEPVYRKCPFGQFWDQNVLTCRLSYQVHCPHDRCQDQRVRAYKHADRNNCCAYWKCQNGRSYGECCGEGHSYNAAKQECVADYECLNTCPFHDEIPACDKRPVGREAMFEQHIGNNYWVPMHCAPGTAFNPVDCECSLLYMTVPGKKRQQVCKPELYLPFTDGFNDRSGKNVYIKPENVTIHKGAAFFNGNSRILINRFANTEFTGDLVIKFRYNEFRDGAYFDELQALVTNGDCGSDPSIVIAKMPGYVLLGAKTKYTRTFALPTLDYDWKEVIYIHNEKSLEGKVCGASMSKWSSGPIKSTHCSMQIGYGNGLQSYVGLIDDLYVYQCRPRSNILNLNY